MIELYKESDHYEMMSSWYRARKLHPIPQDLLPTLGFVIRDVAAGFLYRTDSKLGIAENYIANPEKSQEVRSHALDQITGVMIEAAQALEMKLILAWTALPAIAERACRFGYEVKSTDQILLARGI